MVSERVPGQVDYDLSAVSHSEVSIRGRGGTLGWYVGALDGLPRRLPVDPAARQRYEDGAQGHNQRLVFKRDWGTYSPDGDMRVLADGRTIHLPLEGKYEQLARIGRQFPEAREALARLYRPRSAEPETLWTCACGMQFSRPFAIEIHKESCPQFQASYVPPPPATPKPAVLITCKRCGEQFPSIGRLAAHSKSHRQKKQKDVETVPADE